MLRDAVAWDYATGWVAFVIFVALAATSNRWAVRRLGARWKSVHRWIYLAAPLSVLHWYLFEFNTGQVLLWAGVLLAAKLVHIGFFVQRKWGLSLVRPSSSP